MWGDVKQLGVFKYFFNGRITLKDVLDAVFSQGAHAQLNGFLLEYDGGYVLRDEVADGIGGVKQLVNTLAALVAGVGAFVATCAGEELLLPDERGVDTQLGKQ